MLIDFELYEKMPENLKDLFVVEHDNTCAVRLLDEQSGVGCSRFFYVAKASKRERNEGLENFEEKERTNNANFVIAKCKICRMWIANEWRKNNRPLSSCNCEVPLPQKEEQKREPVKNHHPTVKPVKLMEYLVQLVTPKGGVVLDPFMGSGTTGVACRNKGFCFVGIEMEKEYFEIAKARIGNQKTLKELEKQ